MKFDNLKDNWKQFFQNSSNKVELGIAILLLLIASILFPKFLVYIEFRNGVILSDPILNLFKPIDLTWLIFSIIYSCLLLAIFFLAQKPQQLLLSLKTYLFLLIFRCISILLMPLEAPQGMIALKDPFVEFISNSQTLTKDLFFSGHTATLFMFYLILENKRLKIFFLICALIVGLCVILQHVHYCIDVFSAFFFAYGAWKAACIKWKLRRL